MHKFILRRFAMMIPVLIGVMFIIFTLMYITPGDAASLLLGEAALPEDVAALRSEMGLDRPFLIQFGSYVINVAQLDLGISFASRRAVFDEIADRFPTTFSLALWSVIIAVVVGIPFGIICATKQNTIFDGAISTLGLVALSIPNFWLGLMLILLFSVNLGWLPASGFATPAHWILPSLTIGLSGSGTIIRFTRASMLEVIRQDYTRTARAKGQKESVIILKHALKNALIPVITVVGLQFGGLLGGAILTETVFAIPGIGNFMVQSIGTRDTPVVQGGVLLIAFVFSFVNLLVDIIYGFVDPRIRSQYK
ncbi:MAG: ABC transporter permease [Spirochaetes bacterium]|nr:ABC transporter permease [Spirochaetota bacterium]